MQIPYDSYVCDFAILPCDLSNEENLPIVVIELNPFDEFTDGKRKQFCVTCEGGLFNWALHKNTIMNGPFTFKSTTSSRKETRSCWWRKIISDFLVANKRS